MAVDLAVNVMNTVIQSNGLYDLLCFIRPDSISGEKLTVCRNNNDFLRPVVLKKILAAELIALFFLGSQYEAALDAVLFCNACQVGELIGLAGAGGPVIDEEGVGPGEGGIKRGGDFFGYLVSE